MERQSTDPRRRPASTTSAEMLSPNRPKPAGNELPSAAQHELPRFPLDRKRHKDRQRPPTGVTAHRRGGLRPDPARHPVFAKSKVAGGDRSWAIAGADVCRTRGASSAAPFTREQSRHAGRTGLLLWYGESDSADSAFLSNRCSSQARCSTSPSLRSGRLNRCQMAGCYGRSRNGLHCAGSVGSGHV